MPHYGRCLKGSLRRKHWHPIGLSLNVPIGVALVTKADSSAHSDGKSRQRGYRCDQHSGSNASSPFSSWVTLLSSFVIYGTRSNMVWMNTSGKDVYLCPCFPLSTFILGQEISRASPNPIFASLRLKEYLRGKKYSHAVIQCYLVSHPVLLSPICS